MNLSLGHFYYQAFKKKLSPPEVSFNSSQYQCQNVRTLLSRLGEKEAALVLLAPIESVGKQICPGAGKLGDNTQFVVLVFHIQYE